MTWKKYSFHWTIKVFNPVENCKPADWFVQVCKFKQWTIGEVTSATVSLIQQ